MDKFQQTFLSNISHDFRSPLTSIKGYLEAMEDGTIPPEMASKYIQIVLFETERLTKLTNNILTLNDLDPKSARLNQTDFDIHGIIRHTIETFEGTCKSRKISFKLKFESKELVVHADMERIQQVIYNLVDNAIKFSPTDSTIFISTNTKGEKAFISVKDSGCGISRDNISKIWDRFYKSDSSRGRDKKGSGLGLAIVKEVINAHGEHIDVISTEGVGTEFIFSLRLATR
jgi:signal transduction histidine kinase